MQKGRPTHMVSLALLVALLVGQSPSAWSRPPAEAMRVVQSVPAIEPLTITGVLDESSQVLEDGRFFNVHTFEGVAGQIVVIDLISDEFDSVLTLFGPDVELIAIDDYSGEGTNARLVLSLSGTGRYLVSALSFTPGGIGRYQLAVQPGTAADIERAEQLAEATRLNAQVLELYQAGRYGEAEQVNLEALKIHREQLGGSHPAVATSLNNLAELYREQGRYEEAEPFYQESLAIRREQLGESHPDVATSLNNLALLYREQGRHGEAEPLYQQSLAIRRQQLGESHPDVATSLGNLAGLYQFQGRYEEAETFYQESLAIRRERLGESHSDVATSLNNLAGLYQDRGHYGEAELLYRESLTIWREQLGESHPNVATSFNNLATLYWEQGKHESALSWLQQGVSIEETNLSFNLAIGSDDRKRAYIATISGTTNAALSLHLQDANPAAAHLALNTVLHRKGRVLDAVTDTQQLLRQNLSPELAPLLDEYTAAQTQLATQLYGGLDDQDPEVYRARIDDLRQETSRLENELSRRSAEFRVETTPVEIEAVQALIPSDAALVELVQYRPFDPTLIRSQRLGVPRYAAYILHSTGDPQWVDLGDAEAINTAARAFLAATRTPNNLSQARTTARTLDELVMAPIRPLRGNATHQL
ncbi:MAG: tetratricopeptide repeat protein, partial [Nodosilinea sp.]